jgi:hypothetical protein
MSSFGQEVRCRSSCFESCLVMMKQLSFLDVTRLDPQDFDKVGGFVCKPQVQDQKTVRLYEYLYLYFLYY